MSDEDGIAAERRSEKIFRKDKVPEEQHSYVS